MRPVPYHRSGEDHKLRRWRTGGCSETMERLMRLVVAQGETIQTQLRRLNQRDTQIETYEQQMHLLRVQNLGNDYLLSSYLHDQQNQPQEYPGQASQNSTPNQGYHTSNKSSPKGDNQFGDRVVSSQVSTNDNGLHNAYKVYNNTLMPGVPMPREVHAKPIQLHSNSNDYNKIEDSQRINSNIRDVIGGNNARYNARNRYANNDETFLSEEKSNDSGVVLGDDSLGTSVEERTVSEIEDFTEEEVQERLTLLSKMEDVLTRLLHEEEVIQGLSSTLEVLQTQQKREENVLESDLKKAAEEHAMLVSEARSNEQQIRVLDTSAAQKKKLIEALLQEEVDSDQQTQSLQAHLDYILHLPPTAFRLPEEGDDPPPLPLPPVYPACLVQSLLHNQPAQLVLPSTTVNHRLHTDPSSRQLPSNTNQLNNKKPISGCITSINNHFPVNSFVNRPPSPNPLFVNRAPSPNLFSYNRAPSPIVRNALNNRSCSPNKRKPRQPPPYNHINNSKNIFLNNGSNTLIQQRNNSNIKYCNNYKNNCSKNNCQCSNSNNLKNLLSTSLPSLPNKNNQVNKSIIQGSQTSNRDNEWITVCKDESVDEIPPPLPSCPPPELTPPLNADKNNVVNNNTPLNYKNNASKVNILNSMNCKVRLNEKKASDLHSEELEDDSSRTSSSLCVSSRSSTASDNSISNCSSGSSGQTSDSLLHSNNSRESNKHIRNNNSLSSSISINRSNENVKNKIEEKIFCRSNELNQKIISNKTEKTVGKKDTDSADSNSDTGLSSLHSSSDEGGYPLDTLV